MEISHFTSEIEIYEDGVFDAWGALDLDFMKRRIESGWIAASVPDEQEISLHALGQFVSLNGEWKFTKDGLYTKLWRLLQNLNPGLKNMVDFEGTDVEIKENGARYAKLGMIKGHPLREVEGEKVPSQSRGALVWQDSRWYHSYLHFFADGLIDCRSKTG